MKLTIESTDVITRVDGAPCRLWKSQLGRSLPFDVYVAAIARNDPAVQRKLECYLQDLPRPREMTIDDQERAAVNAYFGRMQRALQASRHLIESLLIIREGPADDLLRQVLQAVDDALAVAPPRGHQKGGGA